MSVDIPEPSPQPPVVGRPNNHPEIIGLVGFMTGLAMLVVSLRLWVRKFVLNTFWLDDWFILLGLALAVGVLACFIGAVNNGGGHHWWDIGVPEEWENMQHWLYALLVVNITGVSIIKISISLTLLRFLTGKWYRWFLQFTLSLVVVYTIATMAPLIFECRPMYYSWAFYRDEGACISMEAFVTVAKINGALNVITDAVLVVLPIPTIVTLKVGLRTKISLIAVISIGSFATATAIVRSVASNVPIQVDDSSWNLPYAMWNAAELNAGLIAASLPPLRPLFSSWLEGAASRLRQGGSDSSRAQVTGHSRTRSTGVRKSGYLKKLEENDIELGGGRDGAHGRRASAPVISSRGVYGLPNNNSEEEILCTQDSESVLSLPRSGIRSQAAVTVHGESS